jgi:acyl carrier protein
MTSNGHDGATAVVGPFVWHVGREFLTLSRSRIEVVAVDQSAILNDLTDIFREVLDDPTLELRSDSTAEDVPNWDSMNHIIIVVEVERHFGIKFQTAEMEELRNVGELVLLIERRLTKAKG